jgi:hypothetical protein
MHRIILNNEVEYKNTKKTSKSNFKYVPVELKIVLYACENSK